MKSKCRIARSSILLGEGDSPAIREHLEQCEACRGFESSECEMHDLIRRRAARPPAPQALRERLFAALEDERRRVTGRGRSRPIRAAAAAGAIAIVAALGGWIHFAEGVREAHRTVAALVSDHIDLVTRPSPAEYVSSSPREISEWLR